MTHKQAHWVLSTLEKSKHGTFRLDIIHYPKRTDYMATFRGYGLDIIEDMERVYGMSAHKVLTSLCRTYELTYFPDIGNLMYSPDMVNLTYFPDMVNV